MLKKEIVMRRASLVANSRLEISPPGFSQHKTSDALAMSVSVGDGSSAAAHRIADHHRAFKLERLHEARKHRCVTRRAGGLMVALRLTVTGPVGGEHPGWRAPSRSTRRAGPGRARHRATLHLGSHLRRDCRRRSGRARTVDGTCHRNSARSGRALAGRSAAPAAGGAKKSGRRRRPLG